ncbi:MAG: type II toxin-antitoxin system VapC family toxin [Gemmatimonadota bacterium]
MVLDASCVVEFLLGSERGREVEPWLEAHEGALHAPDLLDLEVTQVLRKLELAGFLDPGHAGAALEILQALPIARHPALPLLPRVWGLRQNLTAYDAAYAALAEALGCSLLSYDQRLASTPGLTIPVQAPSPPVP